jgi:integrase
MSNNNYSQAYLKKINSILNVIFNYASKYYDLKNNPCIKADSMGRHKSKEMVIYTHEQMKVLLKNIYDYTDYTIFSILFYTGMRKDELFALTKKDINSDKGIININKSYQRIAKENVITPPKTPNSIRKVEIPLFLIKNDD